VFSGDAKARLRRRGEEALMPRPLVPLYRVEAAAEILAIKPASLRKMIAAGEITVVRPSRRTVRVSEEELRRILRDGLRPRRKAEVS
jgi:excisionase family DNA binding protein